MTTIEGLNPDKVALLGDIHGNTKYLIKALKSARDLGVSVVVQLGDMGIYGDYINTLKGVMKNFPDLTLLFIDGNHEDFTTLYDYPVSDEDGVRWFSDNLAHIPRGRRWEWNDKSFVAVGGGISVDRHLRDPYVSWDPRERLSMTELDEITYWWPDQNDYILAHDAPSEAWIPGLQSHIFPDVAIADSNHYRETVMSYIGQRLTPRNWYHGHYHINYMDTVQWEDGSECFVRGLGCDGMPFSDSMEVIDINVN